MNDSIEKRVGTIERRLNRIELHLHLDPLREAETSDVQAQSALAPNATPSPHDAAASAVPLPAAPVSPIAVPHIGSSRGFGSIVEEQEHHEEVRRQAAARLTNATPPPLPQKAMPVASAVSSASPPRITPPPLISQYRKHISAARPDEPNLEKMIGLKWAGWIGAVVLLIGAALGVKYAYDQHWFASLPMWLWPSMIALAGFSLIGAGEIVYRKVHVVPAASLFGAGIATLFLVSYIGHSYYALYSPGTAFALMAMTTFIGSGVAMRGRMVSIAVLSQIGGSIAPFVMGDAGAPHTGFMTYLLMLQVIALVLAYWGRSPRWWALRGVSLATTALWMAAIIAPGADGQLPLWFAIVYAASFQLESILSSLRADADPQWMHIRYNGAAFTTFVTAALTAATLGVLHDAAPLWQATWILIYALVNASLGFIIPTKDRPLTKALTIAYRAVAVALAALAVPVYGRGVSVEISWAFLAVVLAIIGRSIKSGISRTGAIVVWIAALVHLMMSLPDIGSLDSASQMRICLTIDGVAITSAAALAWGLALVGQIIAELHLGTGDTSADKQDDRAAATMSVVASVVWTLACLFALPAVGATFMLLTYGWLMAAMAKFLPRLQTATQCTVLMICATAKWMLADTLYACNMTGWPSVETYIPFVNASIALGLLLSATLFVTAWQRHKTIEAGRVSPLAIFGLLVLAWTITFEIDRAFSTTFASQYFTDAQLAKQVAFSIAWSFFAMIAVAIGFRLRVAGLRYFGLGLLGLTLLKVVVVDLAQVSTGYRILSFLGLGAIMLGTSVLYGKLSPRLLSAIAAAPQESAA